MAWGLWFWGGSDALFLPLAAGFVPFRGDLFGFCWRLLCTRSIEAALLMRARNQRLSRRNDVQLDPVRRKQRFRLQKRKRRVAERGKNARPMSK